MLKWILETDVMRMWFGFIRLRTGTKGEVLWTWLWTFQCHRRQFFWLSML